MKCKFLAVVLYLRAHFTLSKRWESVIFVGTLHRDPGLALSLHRWFPLVTFLVVSSVLWSAGSFTRAQEPASKAPEIANAPASVELADPPQEAQPAQPISLEEVPGRAEITSAELATLLPRDLSKRTLERVNAEADRMFAEVASQLAQTRTSLDARPSIRMLQRAEFDLSEMLTRLRSLEEQLDEHLEALGTSLGRIDRILAIWKATDELAKSQADVGATTTGRIAAVRSEIDERGRPLSSGVMTY